MLFKCKVSGRIHCSRNKNSTSLPLGTSGSRDWKCGLLAHIFLCFSINSGFLCTLFLSDSFIRSEKCVSIHLLTHQYSSYGKKDPSFPMIHYVKMAVKHQTDPRCLDVVYGWWVELPSHKSYGTDFQHQESKWRGHWLHPNNYHLLHPTLKDCGMNIRNY